ncbi:MAG: hypothetical protein PHS46_03570 [Candidatus Omnitrophica bacterium]|nr:hypothetical protein [Candidatus Omnitrophota bacterium]
MAEHILQIIGFVLATSFAGFNIIAAYDKDRVFGSLETAAFSYLFGLGAISLEIFFFGMIGVKFTTVNIIMPWLLFAAINMPRLKEWFFKTRARSNIFHKFSRFETIIAFLLAAIICYIFFIASLRPIESYDAVAIWSLKAKVIYFTGSITPDFFTMIEAKFHGAHSDYPLLLPIAQAWFYTFINTFNDYLVKMMFPINFTAFLIIFYVFLNKVISNRLFALIFTLLLSSPGLFANYATNGYADMQMAIYGSITFLALYLWIKGMGWAYFWTAFFSCIFAMWTKNEGLITFFGFILILVMRACHETRDRKFSLATYSRQISAVLILAVLFISWALFKIYMNVGNDVVNAQVLMKYDPSTIFTRLLAILYEYQRQIFGVKYWNLSWIAFLLLAVSGYRKLFSEENRYIIVPIFFILFSYAVVFFITPQGITWHLRTSLNRLLIHVLPLALFYVAMRVNGICSNELTNNK